MTPIHLRNGQGCDECKSEKLSKAFSMTNEEFKKRIEKLFPNIEVIGEYINSHTKVLVKCKKCNREFYIIPNNAFNRGINCICQNKTHAPKGEIKIFQFLYNNDIEFEYQKPFDGLVGINNGLLTFDFYIPPYNLLIEFQGEQHEHPIKYFGGKEKFKIQQEHDKRKREYAKENEINLLEIWYYDLKNIDSILSKILISSSEKIA